MKINIKLSECIPPKAKYSIMSIDEIYEYISYEAALSIENKNQVFFCDDVAIVEFFWYFANWYKKIVEGNKTKFVYSTVENDTPILTFSPLHNNQWEIDSVWKKACNPIIINEEQLYTEVQNLIENLFVDIGMK